MEGLRINDLPTGGAPIPLQAVAGATYHFCTRYLIGPRGTAAAGMAVSKSARLQPSQCLEGMVAALFRRTSTPRLLQSKLSQY